MSVVFDFSNSLNDVAPVSPMSLSVDRKRKKKVTIDGCLLCVLFLLSSLFKISAVSVVFDFKDSLNDVAPLFPIVLSVDKVFNRLRDVL